MKRDDYSIYINGTYVSTKHKWNSARNYIPTLIKERLYRGEQAEMTMEALEKDTDGFYVQGRQVWSTGKRAFRVLISKQ